MTDGPGPGRSVALPAGTPDYAGLGGLEWDALDGGFVFAAWGSAGQQPSALLRADATGQQMITLALSANNVPRFGGTLLDSGDWIAPGSGTWRYWIVPRGSSLYVPGPPAQADTLSDVTREKFACPGQAFFATQYDTPRRVVHVDATSGQQVVVHTGTAATMPTTAAEVTPLYERDLATVRTGRATWGRGGQPRAGGVFGQGVSSGGQPGAASSAHHPGRRSGDLHRKRWIVADDPGRGCAAILHGGGRRPGCARGRPGPGSISRPWANPATEP